VWYCVSIACLNDADIFLQNHKGGRHVHQNDHGDTYSPTPTLTTTIRLMLATCCTPEWNETHWDISNAFCGTPLDGKDVYMIPPKGSSARTELLPKGTPGIDPDEMWRIKKAMNGLKDINRLFYEYLQSHILGFLQRQDICSRRTRLNRACMFASTKIIYQ
jgi:hypothetical protein